MYVHSTRYVGRCKCRVPLTVSQFSIIIQRLELPPRCLRMPTFINQNNVRKDKTLIFLEPLLFWDTSSMDDAVCKLC